MICVILGRGRHRMLQEEWKQAVQAGARLVELRVDCLRREPDLKRLLAERLSPCVFTARRSVDGGLWRGEEERRQRLMREAILAGTDYVDIEMDIAANLPRYGQTKRIISYHDFKGMPEDLDALGEKIKALDPDIIKVSCIANTVADASRMLQFTARWNQTIPTIGIAMGPLGTFTRILGGKFGSPFTYAGFNPDRIFAPGLVHFQELKRDYFHDQIDAETELFAVIGDPIEHSLSPALHNAAFREVGQNKVMVPLRIPSGTLDESLAVLEWLNLQGISVTIPHKQAIIPLLNRIDKAVERLGACNTVVRRDGQLIGHNTDYRAALSSLEEALGGSMESEMSHLLDKQVLILGAGGVARTIALGVSRRGAGVTICARDDTRANALAEEIGCRSTPWVTRASALCDILINCTPVGMHPEVDAAPVPPAAFRPGMLVFDTVYHPENTMFLKLAREHDCATITGVEMFIRQAALQFHYYTGQDAPEERMRAVIERKLGALRD